MYIKGFKINIDKTKRVWGAILLSVFVAVLLIVLSFIYIFTVSNKKINTNYTKADLFNAKSFYSEYTINVYSNKNQNAYKIKEWYIKNDEEYKFRIETNYESNNFIYLGTNDSISIKSDEQISKINLQNYVSSNTNILSISTFIGLFNNINQTITEKLYDNSNFCKIDEIEHDDYVSYVIELKNDIGLENLNNSDKEICNICNEFTNNGMKVSKIELILHKEKLMPKEYIIYDCDGNTYIDIVYDNFVINKDFDEKLFAI